MAGRRPTDGDAESPCLWGQTEKIVDWESLTAYGTLDWSEYLSPLVFGKRAPVILELRWQAVIANRPPVPEIAKLIAAGWSP